MSLPSLTQTAVYNRDVYGDLVECVAALTPEINAFGWLKVDGTSYNIKKRTALPAVGFRSVNTGVAGVASTVSNTTITLKNLSPQWYCDVAVANSAIGGPEKYIADEMNGVFQSTMLSLGKQFYYGTAADAGGFAGLTVDSTMVVDALGTTATSASGVYVFGSSEDMNNIHWSIGQGGDLGIGEIVKQFVPDPTDVSKLMPVFVSGASIWCGLGQAHPYCVVKIKNVTEDSTKGLTDALIFKAFKLLRQKGLVPDKIMASPRSIAQLQSSRTATNGTGAPAPTPTEVEGVKIYSTNCISLVEAIV